MSAVVGRVAPTGVALPRHSISAEAAETLDGWAWGLADGSLRLWQLPDAVCTFWTVAHEQGRASRDDEVRALKLDADRLWLRVAYRDDKERERFLLDRLDRAAELADRPDVTDVLDEAWRIYCASLDELRGPVRLPANTQIKEVA